MNETAWPTVTHAEANAMVLAIDRRKFLGNTPAAHALVVGISQYRYLPTETAADGSELIQLDMAAQSALDFHDWLNKNQDHLTVPLATCRVMLAPSADENERTPELAKLAGPCGVADFVAAASEWRQDALGNKENILILYFAGHSLELTDMNPVLVFQDFGDRIGPALRATVSLSNLIDGLAPSDWQNQVARQQFLFIDTDRIPPTGVPPESLRRPTEVFDVPRRGPFDDRRSCVLYGTIPGGTAYYIRQGVTFFNFALMNCLRGAAAEPLPPASSGGPTAWRITTRSLVRGVQAELDELKRIHKVEQRIAWSIQGEDAVVVELEGPPEITLRMRFDPPELRSKVRVVVRDEKLEPIVNVKPEPEAEPDWPILINLPAGIYRVEASVDEGEGKPLWESIVQMVPPRVELLARIKP